MRARFLFILIGSLALAACGVQGARSSGEGEEALGIAAAREPKVVWDRSSLLEADFDCDGVPDAALLGRDGEGTAVLVVLGPPTSRSSIGTLRFPAEELCGEPISLKLEDLEDAPAQGCKGVSLSSGECDAFHIFWNREEKGLDWWRL